MTMLAKASRVLHLPLYLLLEDINKRRHSSLILKSILQATGKSSSLYVQSIQAGD